MTNMIFRKLLFLFITTQSARAFSCNHKIVRATRPKCSLTRIAAGGGWGNDDFLSSLGGNDEERDDEREKYNEFKSTREAFDERQRDKMESPAGQKFMQQQRESMAQQQQAREALNRDDGDSTGEFFQDLGMENFPSEGDSKFGNMMRQASGSGMGGGPFMDVGFEQKFAIPLDDEEGENIVKED
jgi:hypothetical protein